MKLEQVRPAVYQVTFHAYEIAALVSAARWVVQGAEGEVPAESVEQLKQVLSSYDAEMARLNKG